MSVKVADRKESHVQFITTAGELLKHTTSNCLKFPKRMTFYCSIKLVDTAQNIYRDLIYANSLYLFTEEHAKKRKELFEKSLGYLDFLSSMLNIAIVKLIDREKDLIKAVMKSDEKRQTK